jgi:hypothetical protein
MELSDYFLIIKKTPSIQKQRGYVLSELKSTPSASDAFYAADFAEPAGPMFFIAVNCSHRCDAPFVEHYF